MLYGKQVGFFKFITWCSTMTYKQRIKSIHQTLGITENYSSEFALILCDETTDLVSIGNDIYDRHQQLTAEAATAWSAMKYAAENEGVILHVVSAFRSVEKQQQIIQRKVDSGQTMAEILKVSAAPGYSEHHTGRALDLTTPGCETLTEAFEETEAFFWLVESAGLFSFYLSYQKDNQAGIAYEPWHWAFIQDK